MEQSYAILNKNPVFQKIGYIFYFKWKVLARDFFKFVNITSLYIKR